MSPKNETVVMIVALLMTGGILGGGYWWFSRQSGENFGQLLSGTSPSRSTPTINQPISSGSPLPSPPSPTHSETFNSPKTVPQGTTVKINGSTTMVAINQALKSGFEGQFSGTQVITDAQGSDIGILRLLTNNIDIAAISRPLTASEQAQGLVAIPMTQDAIAIVVAINNPFRKGLTETQIRQIFQGKITDWAKLGGLPTKIRVINRPAVSGTHQTFRELVLKGENFGNTPNITTMDRDATTPILQALRKDGISYATASQVINQQTVRIVPINGLTPEATSYPYQRSLYYVYKQPPNEAVKAFLGYATSPSGQQMITNSQ
ncbi:phosphate-binding protein PstS-like protein [Rippkaea orientalis PCC 8801]|uniref:Phosphate-binding protein PstS-like protein n=1 Tax=Rippkaea orientalis (strain PCC 8801 / RF-1) TaxID=41431 RepID=B7JW53_RIPO1|nr:phosphate ABC transporter substrate-binding protein [Rippkaea orientalis]ACK65742.1 phosphate-binding protein PstS-like protein [Rippkaea orientalis PCC 8801]